jgi:hypothetical protein
MQVYNMYLVVPCFFHLPFISCLFLSITQEYSIIRIHLFIYICQLVDIWTGSNLWLHKRLHLVSIWLLKKTDRTKTDNTYKSGLLNTSSTSYHIPQSQEGFPKQSWGDEKQLFWSQEISILQWHRSLRFPNQILDYLEFNSHFRWLVLVSDIT